MPVMFIKAVTQDASVSFSSSPHLRRVSRNCKTSMIARCTRLEHEAPPTFGLLVSRPRASHPNGFLLGLDSFYKFRGTNCITKNVWNILVAPGIDIMIKRVIQVHFYHNWNFEYLPNEHWALSSEPNNKRERECMSFQCSFSILVYNRHDHSRRCISSAQSTKVISTLCCDLWLPS